MSGNSNRNSASTRLGSVAVAGLALVAIAVAFDVTSASSVAPGGDRSRSASEDAGWCVTTRLTRAGAATLRCVVVDDSLPGGRVAMRGQLSYGGDAAIDRSAMIAGTGRYRAVRGTLAIDEDGGEDLRLTFRIRG